MEDLYRTLQVDPQAEPEVIEAAWRRLAQVYHPDGGARPDAARMAAINRAHQVLKDPGQRAEYDRQRAQTVPPPPGESNGRPWTDSRAGDDVAAWVSATAPRCWRHRAWAVARCASCGKPLCGDCAGRWRPPHCDRCVIAHGHNQQAWILWPAGALAAWLGLAVIAFLLPWSSWFAGWTPPVWPTLLVTYILGAGAVGGVDLVLKIWRGLSRDVRRRARKSFGVLAALVLLPVTLLAGAVYAPIGGGRGLVAFLQGTAKVRAAHASLRSSGE